MMMAQGVGSRNVAETGEAYLGWLADDRGPSCYVHASSPTGHLYHGQQRLWPHIRPRIWVSCWGSNLSSVWFCKLLITSYILTVYSFALSFFLQIYSLHISDTKSFCVFLFFIFSVYFCTIYIFIIKACPVQRVQFILKSTDWEFVTTGFKIQ